MAKKWWLIFVILLDKKDFILLEVFIIKKLMLLLLYLTERILNHYRKVSPFITSVANITTVYFECQWCIHGLCWSQIKRAKDWILELRKSLPLSFPIILVGNKSDLKQKVIFQSHESITSYHETSAKLNTGIRNVIHAGNRLSVWSSKLEPPTGYVRYQHLSTIWSELVTWSWVKIKC